MCLRTQNAQNGISLDIFVLKLIKTKIHTSHDVSVIYHGVLRRVLIIYYGIYLSYD